jgi:transcriptional adapter 1
MDLATAKRKLTNALGEYCSTYWNTLRQWYKQKITKADFDDQARLLLGESNIHHHNEFLFAILAKCQATHPLPEQSSSAGRRLSLHHYTETV